MRLHVRVFSGPEGCVGADANGVVMRRLIVTDVGALEGRLPCAGTFPPSLLQVKRQGAQTLVVPGQPILDAIVQLSRVDHLHGPCLIGRRWGGTA